MYQGIRSALGPVCPCRPRRQSHAIQSQSLTAGVALTKPLWQAPEAHDFAVPLRTCVESAKGCREERRYVHKPGDVYNVWGGRQGCGVARATGQGLWGTVASETCSGHQICILRSCSSLLHVTTWTSCDSDEKTIRRSNIRAISCDIRMCCRPAKGAFWQRHIKTATCGSGSQV